jgi:hypothetical protein
MTTSTLHERRFAMPPNANDLKEITDHMLDFGGSTLGRAVCESVFSEVARPFAHPMAVMLAAHGAELIIKARIAREHHLLIFDTLPKSTTTSNDLTTKELFEYGKTKMYSELPELLWATVGYRLNNTQQYLEFGKIRNSIMHFAVPDKELSDKTLKFAFEIMDPILEEFWGYSIIPYAVDWDDVLVSDGYLQEQLKRLKITNLTETSQRFIKEMEGGEY